MFLPLLPEVLPSRYLRMARDIARPAARLPQSALTGSRGLSAGVGCGVGLGYGFGAGFMLRPAAAESLLQRGEVHLGAPPLPTCRGHPVPSPLVHSLLIAPCALSPVPALFVVSAPLLPDLFRINPKHPVSFFCSVALCYMKRDERHGPAAQGTSESDLGCLHRWMAHRPGHQV